MGLARPTARVNRQLLLRLSLAGLIGLGQGLHAQRTIYVDDDGSPTGSGAITDPLDSIQAAIVASSNGDVVAVQPGTYFEKLRFLGKAVTVRSLQGSSVTIIEPPRGRGVTFVDGETRRSVLEGFTIQNGSARVGGGIYCEGSDPLVMECVIRGNVAREAGGGVACRSSTALFQDCLIEGNTALGGAGGGMHIQFQSLPSIERSRIVDNRATSGTDGRGGGVYVQNAVVGFVDSVVAGNIADGAEGNAGGGIMADGASTVQIWDSVLANNQVSRGTIGQGAGGAVYGAPSSTVFVINTVFWGDSAAVGPELYADGELTVDFSVVEGGAPAIAGSGVVNYGPYNISADPLFVDPGGRDYHVRLDSPVIDAGRPGDGGVDGDVDPRGLDGDGDGHARMDIGWDEVNPTTFEVNGVPEPGESLSLRTITPAGQVFLHLMAPQETLHVILPFGNLLIGGPLSFVGSGTVPGSTDLALPADPALVGMELHFQSLARSVDGSIGAFSRRVTLRIR